MYKKIDGRLPASAELLSLHGSSAMRVRSPNGDIESRVLKGPDPYSVVIDGTTLRLVHVAIENVPRIHDVESGPRLSFYLTLQDRPTEALAQHALEELRKRTGARNIDVILRNDPWFIVDMDFPVVTPYLSGLVPPSRAQYEGGAEARCTDSVDITYCGSSPVQLMRQYHSIKQQVPGALLMFRLGDFYELLYEDAVTAALELGVKATDSPAKISLTISSKCL